MVSGGLGDLDSMELPAVNQTLLKETCEHDLTHARLFVQNLCKSYRGEKAMPSPKAYGMAVVDWDNDGYMDVTITHDFGNLMLLKNDWAHARTGGIANKFLAIKLKGTVSNEYGIGATILVLSSNMGHYGNKTIVQLREVSTASHETDWWGSRDDRIIFGLGQFGVVEQITVRWPGRGKQEQHISDKNKIDKYLGIMDYPLIITEPNSPDDQMMESSNPSPLSNIRDAIDDALHALSDGVQQATPPPGVPGQVAQGVIPEQIVEGLRHVIIAEPSLEEEDMPVSFKRH